jgi:hypothetical protein
VGTVKKLILVVALVRDDLGKRCATVLREAAGGLVALGAAGRESGAAVHAGDHARRAVLLLAALLVLTLALVPRAEAFVYWANHQGLNGSQVVGFNSIGRANLNGTGADQNFIPLGDDFPCGVAVDDAHVYWTSDSGIGRAKLDGTRADQDFVPRPEGSAPCGVAVDPPLSSPPPTNAFSFGKVKKNKHRGTAKLTVNVPGPGELELEKTKKVNADEKVADVAGKEKLSIKPKGKANTRLNTRGKAKITAKATYTPDGGEPNTESKKIKLVKR